MKTDREQPKKILPDRGIWDIESLANHLGLPAQAVKERLAELGVPTVNFSTRYKHRLFRMEDLLARKGDLQRAKDGEAAL